MVLKISFFLLSIFTFMNCQTQSLEKNKDKVIVDLNKDKIDTGSTIMGLKKAKDILKKDNQMQINIAKSMYSFGRSQIIEPVAKALDVFLDQDSQFDCKPCHVGKNNQGACPSSEQGPLFCDVKDSNGAIIMKASVGGADDVRLHFCHIKHNSIKIKKTDRSFWGMVTHVGGADFSIKATHEKDELYRKAGANVLPFNGVTVAFERIGTSFKVKDFRASVGPVEEGSKEYEEFVSSDCLTF